MGRAVVDCYGLINSPLKLTRRAVDDMVQFLLDPSVKPLHLAPALGVVRCPKDVQQRFLESGYGCAVFGRVIEGKA